MLVKTHCFSVQYAKSSMSTCRVCMAKIVKDSLRVGHSQLEAENDLSRKPDMDERMMAIAGAARWHHFECFPRMKGAKWMAANLPDSPTKLEGFKELKKGDQKKLLQLWKALASPEGKPSSKRKAEMEGKVAKKPASKISAITSVQGVLTSAQFKKVQALEADLSSSTNHALLGELRKNDQPRTGKKEELVSRVAEGRVLGALPSCPKCKHGQIHWSRLGGWFSCPGYYDRDLKTTRRCFFRSKEMKRKEWKK